MNPNWICCVIVLLGLGWLEAGRTPDEREPEEKGQVVSEEHPDALGFHLDELEVERRESPRPYLEFLDVPTLSAGLYVLAAGSEDRQSPHTEDEVYCVIEGRATLTAGDAELRADAGAVIFVRAGVPHRFHSIEEDLKVLVFFSSAKR